MWLSPSSRPQSSLGVAANDAALAADARTRVCALRLRLRAALRDERRKARDVQEGVGAEGANGELAVRDEARPDAASRPQRRVLSALRRLVADELGGGVGDG